VIKKAMNKTYLTYLAAFGIINLVTFNLKCAGQNFIEQFNDLPPTITVRAPVFDVEKKYYIDIDSLHQLIIIQDFRRNPGNKEPHFDQLIYEIPFSELSLGSFRVARDADDKSLINLKIGTVENKTTIIQYFIRDDRVVAIQSQDILELGPWELDEPLEKKLKECIKLLTDKISNKSYNTNLFGLIKSSHKYASDIVTTVGPTDKDKRLSFGYYYAPSLQSPPYYSTTKNSNSSDSKLIKDIKNELKKINSGSTEITPVFVYISASGQIESLHFCNRQTAQENFDLKQLDTFKAGKEGNTDVKCKLLLMIK
jgi:hypothetical protein